MEVAESGEKMDYTQKFEKLLELFPHPERRYADTPASRSWRMIEIERATDGEVNSSYLSALRRGKTKKPGMRMLDLIAQTMGFPFELWLTDPQQWERILREQGADYSSTRGEVDSGGDEVSSVAELLEQLIATITNRRTGRPFTNSEIAENSGGRLSEDEVSAIRSGEIEEPLRSQLVALCNVFGVDLSYWSGPNRMAGVSQEDLEDLEKARNSNRKLLLKKSLSLDDNQFDLLMNMADQLQERSRNPGGGGSEGQDVAPHKDDRQEG